MLSNLLPPLNAVRTKQYIDLAKPKSGACIFFSRTSQGHNALPRPGLGPGSSDSEPSALITGLLDYWTKPWRWRTRGTVDHACQK